MRYRIKARLAELGMKSADLIDALRAEGIYATPGEFSIAINGRGFTPKCEKICEKADEILCKIEREKGIR